MKRHDTAVAMPPSHVPRELVVDFDYLAPQLAQDEDVYVALKRLHALPDIVWTPRHGGHWIVSRSDDVRWVREEAIIFSHEEFMVPRGTMADLLPPTNVDPPYHARFRAVLNPTFAPGAIKRIAGQARETTAALIDELAARGRCEFVDDFARVMPVVIFLTMLELPIDRRAEFLAWGHDYARAAEPGVKAHALAAITGFLKEVLDAREGGPGEDLLSRIAGFRRNPRFQDESEVVGMAMNVFVGGLDTVSNMLAFTVRHLASDPAARRRLVENPELIPLATEEYLRRHGLAITARLVKQDVTRKGVSLRREDMVLVIDPLAGIDERAYPNPLAIDFDRDTRVHDTFGNGVHRCLGEHLARMEVTIFIDEWLKRIPEFRLDPAVPSRTHSGVVVSMSQLGLLWP